MLSRKTSVLIGCGEVSVAESLRVMLGDTLGVTVRAQFDAFVRDASTGAFGLVLLYGNCMSPPFIVDGGLLENITGAIKAVKAATKAPVIALTSMPEWRDAQIAAGADACLDAPVDAALLQNTLSARLNSGVS